MRAVSRAFRRALLSASAGCFAWLSCGMMAGVAALPENRLLEDVIVLLCALAMAAAAATCLLVTGRWDGWRDAFRAGPLQAALLLCGAVYGCMRNAAYAEAQFPGTWPARLFPVVAAGAVPAMYVFLHVSYRYVLRLARSFAGGGTARYEALFFAGFTVLATAFMALSFRACPTLHTGDGYGAVYGFDSMNYVQADCYFVTCTAENDIRNPLFGMLSMPFTLPLRAASDLVLAAFSLDVYPYLIGFLQVLSLAASSVLLSRAVSSDPVGRACFLAMFACAYSTACNVIILEQYGFALFWMAASVCLYSADDFDGLAVTGALAAGFLSSNVLLFVPVAAASPGKAGRVFRRAMATGTALFLLSGQLVRVLFSFGEMPLYLSFFGSGVGPVSRTEQFLMFVRSVFLPPAAEGFLSGGYDVWVLAAPSTYDIAGIALLAAAAAGALVSRSRFGRVCGWWAFVSFCILALMGWGLAHNQLFIYALYFGWAYIGLVHGLLDRLFRGRRRAMALCCGAIASAMAAASAAGLSMLLSSIHAGA